MRKFVGRTKREKWSWKSMVINFALIFLLFPNNFPSFTTGREKQEAGDWKSCNHPLLTSDCKWICFPAFWTNTNVFSLIATQLGVHPPSQPPPHCAIWNNLWRNSSCRRHNTMVLCLRDLRSMVGVVSRCFYHQRDKLMPLKWCCLFSIISIPACQNLNTVSSSTSVL